MQYIFAPTPWLVLRLLPVTPRPCPQIQETDNHAPQRPNPTSLRLIIHLHTPSFVVNAPLPVHLATLRLRRFHLIASLYHSFERKRPRKKPYHHREEEHPSPTQTPDIVRHWWRGVCLQVGGFAAYRVRFGKFGGEALPGCLLLLENFARCLEGGLLEGQVALAFSLEGWAKARCSASIERVERTSGVELVALIVSAAAEEGSVAMGLAEEALEALAQEMLEQLRQAFLVGWLEVELICWLIVCSSGWCWALAVFIRIDELVVVCLMERQSEMTP